jgi:single-strand DNA-binding protein
MLNFNKVILCGVVCNTPSLRQNGNGTNVTNFTLKTIERWKDKTSNEWKKYSKYHKIVVWGKDAERIVKFVKKNVIVLVEGCLNYHKYEKDGEWRNIAEIKASSVEFRGILRKSEYKPKNQDVPKNYDNEFKKDTTTEKNVYPFKKDIIDPSVQLSEGRIV